MPIELELEAPRRGGTTHQGYSVTVRLRNRSLEPLELPNLYDTSAALTFELFTAAARRLRQLNGITQQLMLVGARPNMTPTLETLPPGETWTRTIDLAPYHYLLPPGDLRLRARYEYEPAGLRAFSDLARVLVDNPPLTSVDLRLDACLLESALVLLRSESNGHASWFLRQHSLGAPLAAWYSEPVLHGEPAETVTCSTATFSHAGTFDPMFERWLVWTTGATLHARLHRSGKPVGQPRHAAIPPGWRLLPWCNHQRDGSLLLFFEAGPARLECRRLAADGLAPVFGCDLTARLAAVAADEDSVHLLLEHRGVVHERLTLTGEHIASDQLFRSRLPLHACELDPLGGQVKALFREAPHGASLEMFGASLISGESTHARLDRLLLRHPVTELAFDRDRNGRFHLLAATTAGKLYYFGPNLGPVLVARGPGPFFPRILARKRPYLGYYDPACGYLFRPFVRNASPKLLSFDAPAD